MPTHGADRNRIFDASCPACPAIVEVLCQSLVEEDDGFADRHAVLGAAEAEHVDACLPGEIGRRAAEHRAGMGEASAIHMQLEPQLPASVAMARTSSML